MSSDPSLQFEINGVPFAVRCLGVIADNDPEAVGCIIVSRAEIHILSTQTLASAFSTLAHEVGHAWLGRHPDDRLPSTIESFCESFADVMPKFVSEFTRQGGIATLAEMMGLPHEGNETALSRVAWTSASAAERQLAIVRHVLCWHLTDIQFEQYRALYEAAKLNPLLGDCYARKTVKDGKRIAIELGTTIKAMRRLAHRSGLLAGIGRPEWAGDDGVFQNVWPKSKGRPMFAQIWVKRKDSPELFWGVARWDSFVQTIEIDGKEILTWWWDKMDDHMLAKCAEVQALWRAIAQLDGVIPDELLQQPLATAGQAKAIERRPNKTVREERLAEQLEELHDASTTAAAATAERPRNDGLSVEPESEETARSSDAELHQAILRVSSLIPRADRVELVADMRRKMGDVEDDNPPAFARAVFEEAKRRWGKR